MKYANQAATFSMIVASVIETRLKAQGLNQLDLFSRTGIAQATWARLCKGHSKLDLEQLYRIQTALGYPILEIMEEAQIVEKQAEVERIRIIPPQPTINGRLTMQDGLVIVTLGALVLIAIRSGR